ncbi:Ion transport protein-domain-containing protein, partial [Blastocladiella britannica]
MTTTPGPSSGAGTGTGPPPPILPPRPTPDIVSAAGATTTDAYDMENVIGGLGALPPPLPPRAPSPANAVTPVSSSAWLKHAPSKFRPAAQTAGSHHDNPSPMMSERLAHRLSRRAAAHVTLDAASSTPANNPGGAAAPIMTELAMMARRVLGDERDSAQASLPRISYTADPDQMTALLAATVSAGTAADVSEAEERQQRVNLGMAAEASITVSQVPTLQFTGPSGDEDLAAPIQPPPLPPRDEFAIVHGVALLGRSLGYFGPAHPLRKLAARVVTATLSKLVVMLLLLAHFVLMAIRKFGPGESAKFTLLTSPLELALVPIFACYTVEVFLKLVAFGAIVIPPVPTTVVGISGDAADVDGDGILDFNIVGSRGAGAAEDESIRAASVADDAALAAVEIRNAHSLPRGRGLGDRVRRRTGEDQEGFDSELPMAVDLGMASVDHAAALEAGGHLAAAPSTQPSRGIALAGLLATAGLAKIAHNIPHKAAATDTAAPGAVNSPPFDFSSTGTTPVPSSTAAASFLPKKQPTKEADEVVIVKPYLRSSFNRIDALSVISFWLYVVLGLVGGSAIEGKLWPLRGLAALRPFRFLALTRGTRMILASLKASRRLLRQVAVFIGFIFLIFALTSVLAFKSSLQRQCMLDGQPATPMRYCGGYLTDQGVKVPPRIPPGVDPSTIDRTALPSDHSVYTKGYSCPFPQECWLGQKNANNGFQSFDNLAAAALLQFTIMTGENWSPTMYATMQAESRFASLYFVAVFLVLGFLLLQLFIAVISETFSQVRGVYLAERRRAALESGIDDEAVAAREGKLVNDTGACLRQVSAEIESLQASRKWVPWALYRRRTALNILHGLIWRAFFFLVISVYTALVGLVATDQNDDDLAAFMKGRFLIVEITFTVLFALDVALGIVAAPTTWTFVRKNPIDIILAPVTIALLFVPFNRYLTGFLVARTYKLVTALPPVRELVVATKRFIGIGSVVAFSFVALGCTATMGMQLFGGSLVSASNAWVNYNDFASAFVYTFAALMTEDNWPDILYGAMNAHKDTFPIVGPIFSALWVLAIYCMCVYGLVNLLVVTMIDLFEQEDEEKRHQQVAVAQSGGLLGLAVRASPLHRIVTRVLEWFANGGHRQPRPTDDGNKKDDHAIAMTALDHKKSGGSLSTSPATATAGTSDATLASAATEPAATTAATKSSLFFLAKSNNLTQTVADGMFHPNVIHASSRDSLRDASAAAGNKTDGTLAAKILAAEKDAFGTLRSTQPTQIPFLRRLIAHPIFTGFFFLVILASVVTATMDTPVYRLQQARILGDDTLTAAPPTTTDPFYIADLVATCLFGVEIGIKLAAYKGLPYFGDMWNWLDFGVFATMAASYIADDSTAHALRMARALRPLRIISYLQGAQSLFLALVLGIPRISSAIAFSMLVLFPYALYGMFLFAGRLASCNDLSVWGQQDCTGMFQSPTTGLWTPRVWGNIRTSYNWDSIGNSLITLFTMASKEGWTDMMRQTQAITGRGQQPASGPQGAPLVSWWHALYSVSFAMVGSIFALNLFISVIVRAFDEMTGKAYLTGPQKAWENLLRRISAIRVKALPPPRGKRSTLAQMVINFEHRLGRPFYRFVTATMALHILVLCTESSQQPQWLEDTKEYLFLAFVAIYTLEMIVALTARGPRAFFAKSYWNVFDTVLNAAAIAFVVAQLFIADPYFTRLQKLFLIGYALRLARRVKGLHTLFRTMGASFKDIVRIYLVLGVLLLFFGLIMTELFSLTRFGTVYDGFGTFRNSWTSILLLFRLLTGDDWPSVLNDVKITAPNCVSSPNPLGTDCGHRASAFVLFIIYFI